MAELKITDGDLDRLHAALSGLPNEVHSHGAAFASRVYSRRAAHGAWAYLQAALEKELQHFALTMIKALEHSIVAHSRYATQLSEAMRLTDDLLAGDAGKAARDAILVTALAEGVLPPGDVAAMRRVLGDEVLSSPAVGPHAGGPTPDGRLDVSLVRPAEPGAGPTDLGGVVALLANSYTADGGVAVTFIGVEPNRRVIVAVSGTERWNVGGTNPDDLSTNITNAFGAHNLKELAIRQAMSNAGVQPSDRVLLVGHSQGGADVIDFAADPVNTRQFKISGVVTAGAPITRHYPAVGVPVLELRTNGDIVPSLGLPGAPHRPDNVAVAPLRGNWEDPLSAHEVANYVSATRKSDDLQVLRFVDQHGEFLGNSPSVTFTYSSTRLDEGLGLYE